MYNMNVQGDLMGASMRQGSFGSRAEFEKFMPEVPERIQDELHNGKLRLGDQIVYSIKPVNGSKTIKMFETQDQKEVGEGLCAMNSLLFLRQFKDFMDFVNPDSLKKVTAYLEPSLKNLKIGDQVQFQRLGYFNVDKDSIPDNLVFNRTATLRDTWAKLEQKS